jgi:hypothetical protein
VLLFGCEEMESQGLQAQGADYENISYPYPAWTRSCVRRFYLSYFYVVQDVRNMLI